MEIYTTNNATSIEETLENTPDEFFMVLIMREGFSALRSLCLLLSLQSQLEKQTQYKNLKSYETRN